MKGYIQIYTGNGKGKTTAALGLALRAVGAGMKVFIAQFMKGRDSSEFRSLLNIKESVVIKQFGRYVPIIDQKSEEDVRCARAGLEEVREAILSGSYDLVI